MNKERPRQWALGPEGLPETWRRLDAMEDRIRATCWMLMLLTGLRSHDARSMRWEHLDDDGVLLVPSPKGGKDRAFKLPLPRYLLQNLEMVRQQTKGLASPFAFPSLNSESGHVEEMRRTNEFPYAPHQMRHTYRTAALEAGGGHADYHAPDEPQARGRDLGLHHPRPPRRNDAGVSGADLLGHAPISRSIAQQGSARIGYFLFSLSYLLSVEAPAG
ncbi:integrase family protein (plasmid) [Rhizobium gallicum bv. gallicum R602sp]|uniref:Integrase family protein n=1 Tax=Rhizobium gallicum bv. gallicum R602sp TaxID=1041138 RepID=A0A0B4X8U7_9HYPH|nr:integrase family protein [Rhizobium gallicum bv. gallicum R602sp]TDW34078.1 phage integrase family protein [Rhizobium azibense]